MSELLNKYAEQHSTLVDMLVEYHSLHMSFLEKQNPSRAQKLRRSLKAMKKHLREMETTVIRRKEERSYEWGLTHRVKKEKPSE